jgi:hypothetical protein
VVKHTYKVTCPDGTIVTRTTDRKYTHVIVGRDKEPNRPGRNFGDKFFAITWAGTPALAEKAYLHAKNAEFLTYQGVRPGKKAQRTGNLIYADVKKIEV